MTVQADKTLHEQEKDKLNMQKIQRLCLFDDEFMKKCFEDQDDCVELVLRIIMDRPDLKVTSSKTEYVIQNLQGRSVRFDIKATDSQQKQYDIEVQRADKGAGQKRARHNSSMMDANALKPKEDVNKLPETYVIFITENDVLGAGEPVYEIERKIIQTDELFNDGSHILYVNGAYRGDTPIGRLMQDFACKNAKDMFYGLLSNRVRYFKEDKEGANSMSRIMEEIVNDEKKEIALELIALNEFEPEKIAAITHLTVEEVNDLIVRASECNA